MSFGSFTCLVTRNLALAILLGHGLGQAGFAQEEAENKALVVELDTEAMGELIELQDEAVEAEVMRGNPFGFEPGKIIAAKRFHLKQVFQVEIELIERLCEPTAQQKAKLRVAAKGAVKKLSAEWLKKTGQRFGAVPVPAQQDGGANQADDTAQNESEEQAEEEIKDASEIDDNMAQFLIMEVTGNPFRTVPPQDEKAWTTLVAGILTAEQVKTLSDFRATEAQQKRDEMLQSVLGGLTRELGLTPEQREKLQATFQPHFENAVFKGIAFFEPYMGYYYASKAKNEELAAFLSHAQIQKLRIFLWPARQIEQMMEMEQ